jgi:predicted PurR-regulated permease PerM
MNDSSNLWLAIIAISCLVMALVQVGAIIAGAIAARQLQARVARLEQRVEHGVQPLMERLTVISADAARLSALAVQQAEKADVALTSAAQRMDQTLSVVQNAVVAPAREGMALASALRAAVGSIRKGAPRRRAAAPAAGDEDDALFIG